jgi:signal transduction histidine kinase
MSTPLKLLILEDNAFDAELEVGKLQAAGYDCDWQQVQTREEFEARLEQPDFDLILADYNLPSFDGLSALRLLRERNLEIPFVLISGTLGEERAIESLKAGATDYVMKERLERLAPVVARALNDRLERANRRAAQQALRDAHRRLQALSVRLLQVEETERRRIARDLHDGVGQLLTAVKLRLAGLNPASADYVARRGECVAAIDEALEQVRRVSRDLRPSQLDDLGLVAALRSHLDRQAGSAGFKPNFAHERVPQRLAPEIETTCFRIAQEALTNIARHARASEVWITLAGTEEELRMEVRDNGRGFDVAAARLGATAGKSMGLLSMEERATLAGGRFAIESALGRETRLRLALPLARAGAGHT